MAYRTMDVQRYEKMLAAFREAPGVYRRAAAAAGVDPATARKAWLSGWPQFPWAPAIKETFEREQVAARARQRLEEEAARARVAERAAEAVHGAVEPRKELEAARASALEERTANARLIRGVRANLVAMMNVTSGWLRVLVERTAELQAAMRKKNPEEAIHLSLVLMKAIKQQAETAESLHKMSRLELGDPTEIVERVDASGDADAAAKAVARARRALARAQRLGVIPKDLLPAEDDEPPTEH